MGSAPGRRAAARSLGRARDGGVGLGRLRRFHHVGHLSRRRRRGDTVGRRRGHSVGRPRLAGGDNGRRARVSRPSQCRGRVAGEVPGREIPVLGVLRHRLLDHGAKRRIQVGERTLDRGRRLVHMGEQLRDRVLTLVRNRAAQHLEEHTAQRVDVGPSIRLAAGDLLGRHVVDGADDGALRGQPGDGVEPLRDAEVGEVRVLLAVADRDQDVRRLDVAVDEPARVGRIERGGELRQQLDRSAGLERARPSSGRRAGRCRG